MMLIDLMHEVRPHTDQQLNRVTYTLLITTRKPSDSIVYKQAVVRKSKSERVCYLMAHQYMKSILCQNDKGFCARQHLC